MKNDDCENFNVIFNSSDVMGIPKGRTTHCMIKVKYDDFDCAGCRDFKKIEQDFLSKYYHDAHRKRKG